MIDILLATYNSSLFLKETLDSVIQQEYQDWRLWVRDGGSSDNTREIIEQFVRMYPDKIVYVRSEGRSSACENFSVLLSESTAPYVMFCDHDDIWLPGKISNSLRRLREEENKYGSDEPLLLFTDKKVVDRRLQLLCDSYFQYQHLNSKAVQLNRLLVQNVPSGCTMMINRALVDLCRNIPPHAIMHDHWISLVAAAFGEIIFLNEPTVLYRQHHGNVYGASRYGLFYFFKLMFSGIPAARTRFYQNVKHASLFLHHFQHQLGDSHKCILSDFASLRECSFWNRRRILIRHKIFKTGLLRNAGMFLIV